MAILHCTLLASMFILPSTDCSIASFPGSSLASSLSPTVQKTAREPGRFDHVHNDVLCVVLCVVLVIELLPTHAVFDLAGCRSA